jgi:hypothetical protein
MALTKVRGSGIDADGQEIVLDADGDTSIDVSTDDTIVIDTAGSERARIDSSGNLLVSTNTTTGFQSSTSLNGSIIYASGGIASNSATNDVPAVFNRIGDNGTVIQLKKDGSTVGLIGSDNGVTFIESAGGGNLAGIGFSRTAVAVEPRKNSAFSDNEVDVGSSTNRFDDVHATNGTIQTSDQNEKQDIASVTAKELTVAKKLSTLFKTFRWKDKVTEKGDKARTHTGIIAQEVQSAFSAEGLDASDYGLFISNTWTNEEGKEQTRLGVRYPELFSFIFSSIEARLTALESK